MVHLLYHKHFVEKCNAFGGAIPGAQGVPEDMLRKAATMAVCKINIDTDLRLAMTASIREVLANNPAEFDPRKYLGPARDAIKRHGSTQNQKRVRFFQHSIIYG